MNWFRNTLILACLLITINLPSIVCAAGPPEESLSEIYTKHQMTLQVVSGVVSSPFALASRTPDMDYAQTNVRLGFMLNSPKESKSLLRGNAEALLEVTNSFIFEGPGSYMGGITGLIRYNFVQPGSLLVPYLQAGIGLVYNDAYKDKSQNAIGRAIEFTPQMSAGLRYLVGKNWSLDAEAMFHHISNAGLSDRNRGINAFGGFIGVTYFFDRR